MIYQGLTITANIFSIIAEIIIFHEHIPPAQAGLRVLVDYQVDRLEMYVQ
jgi:hypothetical protein